MILRHLGSYSTLQCTLYDGNVNWEFFVRLSQNAALCGKRAKAIAIPWVFSENCNTKNSEE